MKVTLFVRFALVALVALVGGACTGDLPEPFDLDHTRIVAVQATPPGILSGETSTLVSLLATEGATTHEAPPEEAIVVSPLSLASALAPDGSSVTAPDEAALAAARTELGLMPTEPVPLRVAVSYNGRALVATKIVILGEARSNPSIDSATINGMRLADLSAITIDAAAETRLAVDATTLDAPSWLSSVGTVHDYDQPTAYITVDTKDLIDGEFALVYRDAKTGVTWRVWPIHADGTPRKPQ